MKNTKNVKKVLSIAECWEEAKTENSLFFFWNGTCHLSTTLKNSEEVKKAKSFAQCHELAINENSNFFFWNSNENGACHLSKEGFEDSQICTTPKGSKYSINKPQIKTPKTDSRTVRTDYCIEEDDNQCNEPELIQISDHEKYQCAKMDKENCIFYTKCKQAKKDDKYELWASSKTKHLKNAEIQNLSTLYECWNKCKVQNCVYFSWNEENKTCQISDNNTKICLTSNETDPVIQAKSCTEMDYQSDQCTSLTECELIKTAVYTVKNNDH